MTIEQMAAFLREYEQKKAMVNNVYRYSNQVGSVEACKGVFGMDFDTIMPAPDDQKANLFLAQEKRAALLRDLMAGNVVDDTAMEAAFGFSAKQLTDLQNAQNPVKKEIPKKICVLCFDDALRSQYEYATPVLKKFGFNATFFITEMEETPMKPGFENKDVYMTWEQIADLELQGFELGNHSLHHVHGSQDMGYEFNVDQIRGMEAEFTAHGLKKPVTYAYPSGISNPEVVKCARDCGYIWGRGNQEKGKEGIRGMTYYDPLVDSPLAVCNFGDPDFYSEELLQQRIDLTPNGMIFGLTYHDVDPKTWLGSCSFDRQMEILAENNIRVISMRQMEEFIDPEKAYWYTI